jgi:hypothetical protein
MVTNAQATDRLNQCTKYSQNAANGADDFHGFLRITITNSTTISRRIDPLERLLQPSS